MVIYSDSDEEINDFSPCEKGREIRNQKCLPCLLELVHPGSGMGFLAALRKVDMWQQDACLKIESILFFLKIKRKYNLTSMSTEDFR